MSEDIRRIISGKMRDLKDPRIHGGDMLTIVRCDVAGDGSFCKVYVSSFEGYDVRQGALFRFGDVSGRFGDIVGCLADQTGHLAFLGFRF